MNSLLKSSLYNKLLLTMGGALLLSLLFVAGINSWLLERMLDDRLLQTELPTILKEIRNDIEKELATPLAVSKSIASNEFVIDWMKRGEPPEELDLITQYQSTIFNQFNASTIFIVSEPSNTYYHERGILKNLQRSEPRDQWFYSFLASGKDYSIDIDEATNKATVFINYGIKIDGEIRGVGGIGRSMDAMTDMIRNYTIGESGIVFLVDEQGLVKLHPDQNKTGALNINDQAGLNTVVERVKNDGQFQFGQIDVNGEAHIVAALPLPSLNWYVVAELPSAELYAALRVVLLKTALVSLVIAVVFLVIMAAMAKSIVSPIKKVSQSLTTISQQGGDLTLRLPENREDELGDLAKGFNLFVSKLQSIIQQVLGVCNDLEQSLSIVSSVVGSTTQRASDQEQKTELVATAVNEMGATVQDIARNANEAADYTKGTRDEANKGAQIVNDTISNIHELSANMESAGQVVRNLAKDVDAISGVLDVIRGISEQTNLLALNAAIEAARAGEQGRGFAVVADEVRTLAQRTQDATEEIRNTIEQLQNGATQAVDSMEQGRQVTATGVDLASSAGEALSTITRNIDEITSMNQQVAVATEEQNTVTEDINRNIVGIADIAKETSTEVKRCEDSCRQMANLANDLFKIMKQFEV